MTSELRNAAVSSVKLSLNALIGFVGFTALLSSFMGLVVIAPEFAHPPVESFFARIVCSVVLATTFLVMHLISQSVSGRLRRFLPVCSVLGFGAIAGVMFLPVGGGSAQLVLYGVASLGLGTLSMGWFCFLCTQCRKDIPLLVSAAVGTAVVVCVGESYLVETAAHFAIVLVWLLSLGCFLAMTRIDLGSAVPNMVSNKDSDKRSKILWTSALMLSISNFQFGFLVSSIDSEGERALCLGVAAVVSVLLSINFLVKGAVNERSLSPLTPPFTMLAFLSLYLFGEHVRFVALCLLSALFTVYAVFGIAAIAEHVLISKLSAIRSYGKARFFDYVGMLLGFICGFYLSHIAGNDTMLAAQMSALIAVVYGFIAAFCHKARFPETSMEEGRAAPEAKGLWKKRCQAVGEQCDLSERQYEVLVLVAQGRNAKYIEQSLSISLSTAQTHIRNIYRKTGVHSRQELLDLIEDTKLYGEE